MSYVDVQDLMLS